MERIERTPYEEYWAEGKGARGGWAAANLITFLQEHIDLRECRSVIDVGAGDGDFLLELHYRFASTHLAAIDIYVPSIVFLAQFVPEVYAESIIDHEMTGTYDMVFADGLLSCVPPEHVAGVYRKLIDACDRYFVVRDYVTDGTEYQLPHYDSPLFVYDHASRMKDYPEFNFLGSRKEEPGGAVAWLLFERR